MIEVPFLTYEAIGRHAGRFLEKYHPTLDLPIPIEAIIEFQLGLDIVPMPNLYRDHGIEGFLTSDMTTIYVDNIQYEQYEQKYRFTLAHEVGHCVLHSKILREVSWRSIDEYVTTRLAIDARQLDWFETH